MIKFNSLLMSLIALGFIAHSALATSFLEPKSAYSADTLMTVVQGMDGNPMSVSGKVYYSKGDERREMTMMGQTSIIITNKASNAVWVLMPEQKMYLENPQEAGEQDFSPRWDDDDVKKIKVGSGKVNGVATTKYRVSAREDDGTLSEGFLWLSGEDIVMRMEGSSMDEGEMSHFTMELKNLQLGRQSASLFEIPAGYSRFQVPVMGEGQMLGTPQGTMQPDVPHGEELREMSGEDIEAFKKQMQDAIEQMKQQMQNQQ